jgi:sugar/nucleoside kinase (ribokinase family)
MDKRFDVVVVGNVGVDTNVYLPGADVDLEVESNFTENVDYVGQAGGYTSRGYAQLGWRTAFVGHVGEDVLGGLVRRELASDGVDLSALFLDPTGTARSVNLMYRDGRRRNFYDGKGHMALQPDYGACRKVMAGARLCHFHIPNWARYLLPMAREMGLSIACDVQDVVRADDPYRKDFVEFADVVFFSATNQDGPEALMAAYLESNPDLILVAGMGAAGVALGTKDGVECLPAVETGMPVIDTNGAGDGLAVGFLSSYYLEGCSLRDALLRGQIVARHTCSLKASTSALITREELAAWHRLAKAGQVAQ